MQSDYQIQTLSPMGTLLPGRFQSIKRFSYRITDAEPTHWPLSFRLYKAAFDILLSLLAIPAIVAIALVLFLVNPLLNPGPVFFRQERLGRHFQPFTMWKFRTMTVTSRSTRGAEDGVEQNRITPLGRVLRKMRIDELPNFFNVLRGEMSVIGPRPDSLPHARTYLSGIPHYGYRTLVKPGITGLAQIEAGYAEGTAATARKAHFDHLYVEASCWRLDAWIAWRTAFVVLSGSGAK
ncbi:MAG: sugar transferase [Pseudomonadota bacterium]